jgi:APA family basic amino acid/polyamine antiporter
VPHRAEVAVGAVVVLLTVLLDLREAIGFSSFTVLAYYAIANASAWTLPSERVRWHRSRAGLGLVGCVVLAVSLPGASVVGGIIVLALGLVVWRWRRR